MNKRVSFKNISNQMLAIYIASTLSDSEIKKLFRLVVKKYNSICRWKHVGGGSIKRRNAKDESEYGKAKKLRTVFNLAKDIKHNGNLLIEDSEDLEYAKVVIESFLSDMFNKDYSTL